MKLYKTVVPYLLGAASLFNINSIQAQEIDMAKMPQMPSADIHIPMKVIAQVSAMNELQDYHFAQMRVMNRAENTCNMYIENMLMAQKKIAPTLGTRNYYAAVRKELPGAPAGRHCMYGQYTQLLRALEENGDTLTVIPSDGKSECGQFKNQMREKYKTPEYAGVIKEGRAFESDSAYNAALEKFLARHGVGQNTPDSVRSAAVAEFAKHNFSAQQVSPGSIWIVPRFRGAKTKFHAIMFLGEGRVAQGEFIPDKTGRFIYTGHNRERIGDMFDTWDMSNVFSADIEKILQIEYAKELRRLNSMSRDQMIEYVRAGSQISLEKVQKLTHNELLRLVHKKYFGEDMQVTPQSPTIAQAVMLNQMHQNQVG